MKHPGEIELALFAGGDLGFVKRWRVGKHVRECGRCRSEVQELRFGSETVRDLADEIEDGVNWARLSQEMTGNIRVGLAAGECVGPVRTHFRMRHRHPRSLAWNAMAVLAAAFVIVLGALWLNTPREQTDHLISALRSIRFHRVGTLIRTPALLDLALKDNVVLEASPSSIVLRSNGGTMSFLTPRTEGVAVSVNMQGSAGAQYVDSDTGQVTINRVYYAQ